MKKNEQKAIDSIISEFEKKFDHDANFNTKISVYLDRNEDEWADIWEAKDDLDDAIMIGATTDDEKVTLANAFAAVATKVFTKNELKADFPISKKLLSKVDVANLGGDVEKLSIALDL